MIWIILLTIVASVNSQRYYAYSLAMNGRCMSSCVPYEGYFSSYYFCWTGWRSWEYCQNVWDKIEPQFYTSLKINADKPLCLSDCAKAGYNYYWCFTSEDAKEWDYCSPQNAVSYEGLPCDTTCAMYLGKNYYTCVVKSEPGEQFCSPGPKTVRKPPERKTFPIGFTRYQSSTASGKPCMSTCTEKDNDVKCRVGWKDWEKCIEKESDNVATLYYTSGKKQKDTMFCTSECMQAGEKYFWCFTSEDPLAWDHCSPKAGYSDTNKKCIGPCSFSYFYDHYVCDVGNDFETCSPSPAFEDVCPLSPPVHLERKKRSSQPNPNLPALVLTGVLAINVRQFFANPPSHYDRSSITSALGLVQEFFTRVFNGVQIVFGTRATLRRNTLPPPNSRPDLLANIARRMRELNGLPRDEQGHLLAHSLGGVSDNPINFVPQHTITNRRAGHTLTRDSLWRRRETQMQRLLLRDPEVETIDWYLVIEYNVDLSNPNTSRRPIAFGQYYVVNYRNGTSVDCGEAVFTNFL